MQLAILDRSGTTASEEAVMDSASAIYRWGEDGDEDHRWSAHAQHARDVEVAARDFVAHRNSETAATLLATTLLFWSESPEPTEKSGEFGEFGETAPPTMHLACVAAAHLASSEHPIRSKMQQALHPVRRQDMKEIANTAREVWSDWEDERLFEQSVQQAEDERRMRDAAEAKMTAAHDEAWKSV